MASWLIKSSSACALSSYLCSVCSKLLTLQYLETKVHVVSTGMINSTGEIYILSSAAFHKYHANSMKHAFLEIVSHESLFPLDKKYDEKLTQNVFSTNPSEFSVLKRVIMKIPVCKHVCSKGWGKRTADSFPLPTKPQWRILIHTSTIQGKGVGPT